VFDDDEVPDAESLVEPRGHATRGLGALGTDWRVLHRQ
jgi:hypothetical protein